MGFLFDNCTLQVYNEEVVASCEPFDCGNEDLNDFFQNDALNYQSELLGKTYCFTLDENPKIIVCAFTISNDSIKTTFLPNSRKKKVIKDIPRQKQMKSYPAVLIGRLGVNKYFRNVPGEIDRTGKQLMNFIKSWFIDGANKTGCRFIVVDSYNTLGPLKYYSDNGFIPLFSTEDQEKEFTGLDAASTLETRLMFYDLILLKV
ncbi:N-acetyltransferase [Flavobacterium sp. NG2]|uniref:N-acetyltransferase n=1 Tax=Flavobacterium sp. NG2 TaxID=3097547 RepID=UPI002A7EC362|nr:N-acetyltransferase [Flavobacterium sp. NG2]WPR72354.1 N-acetyltransferase [Flavobacterium sp. NG2]